MSCDLTLVSNKILLEFGCERKILSGILLTFVWQLSLAFFKKDFKSRTKAVYYIDARLSKQSLFRINPWAVQAEKAYIHLSEGRKKTL